MSLYGICQQLVEFPNSIVLVSLPINKVFYNVHPEQQHVTIGGQCNETRKPFSIGYSTIFSYSYAFAVIILCVIKL
jgi:hypothetical protein